MTEKFGDWGNIVAVFLEIMLTLQSACESRTKAEKGVQKGSCNETLYCKALNMTTSEEVHREDNLTQAVCKRAVLAQ